MDSSNKARPADEGGPHQSKGQGEPAGAQSLAERHARLQRSFPPQLFKEHDHLPASVHPYVDPAGRVVALAVRFEKQTVKRWWIKREFTVENGTIERAKRTLKGPLYRQPEVLQQTAVGGNVAIVECEEAADVLSEHGIVATTSLGGLVRWGPAESEVLKGAHVTILPSNDPYGWWLALNVAESLAGVAASVKLVGVPGADRRPDDWTFNVGVWLREGGTRETLLEAIRVADVQDPDAPPFAEPAPDRDYGVRPLLAALGAKSAPTSASESATDGSEASSAEPQADAAPPDPDPLATLLPQHRDLITASAISTEVAIERCYRSVTVKATLETLGFSSAQRCVPALHLPVWGVTGEIVSHQIRPDMPRTGAGGKALKYENPKAARMHIDVPPRVREKLGVPTIPLLVTEGIRKADSAVSHGHVCIALLGVWNWRGTNEDGGKTALPEWEFIALNGRDVFVIFDSDVTTRPQVRDALRRLKEFLELRKAKVRIVRLPEGELGAKVGLDDFLAQGGDLPALLKQSTGALPPKPANEGDPAVLYTECRLVPQGMVRVDYDLEGGEMLYLIANFQGEIVASVVEDDGVTQTQHFEIVVRRAGQERRIEVPAGDFSQMAWVNEKLDPKHVVSAGTSNRDHTRAAIQRFSRDPARRTIYLHTGWRLLNLPGASGAAWAFLHGEGAIGARGVIPGIEVRLPDTLEPLRLPPPPNGDERQEAVRAALRILDLAPDRISVPLLSFPLRAVLGGSNVSGHCVGVSGSYKTEAATLIQRFFGIGFSPRKLPGSWSSTGNALETVAFTAKDVVCTVDDFVAQGGQHDVARLHREADRLLRAQGNNSGRQRLNADATLRATRPPRGLIVSTGEDTPAGQSLRARLCIVEISKGDITSEQLTRCQQDADKGLYVTTMSAYVCWLASRRTGLEERVFERVRELRSEVSELSGASHRRTIDVIGQLYAAIEIFAEFAVEVQAIDASAKDALLKRCWTALLETGARQSEAQAAFDAAEQFIVLLRSALNAGEAHLVDAEGNPPSDFPHEQLGWQRTLDGSTQSPVWQARGSRVGWLINGEVLLDPTAAFRAAQKMAEDVSRIALTTQTLGKRLAERGLLLCTDKARGKNTVRRRIQSGRHDVLVLRASLLMGGGPEAPEAPDLELQTVEADPAVESGAASAGGTEPERPDNERAGPKGPVGPHGEQDAQGEWGEA